MTHDREALDRDAPVHISEDELVDPRRRLTEARWPHRETVDDWSQGSPLHRVQALCDHWRAGYDWRRCEAMLNGWPPARPSIRAVSPRCCLRVPLRSGWTRAGRGKPAMADLLTAIAGSTMFGRFDLDATYPARDDGMVLEYHCQARAGEAEAPSEQRYVAVIVTAGGRISLYHEYVDPSNIPGVAEHSPTTALDRTPLEGSVASLDAILKAELGTRLVTGADTFRDMFDDDGVLECPFAPRGLSAGPRARRRSEPTAGSSSRCRGPTAWS